MDNTICVFCLEGEKVYKDPYAWQCNSCGMNGNDQYPVLGIEEINESPVTQSCHPVKSCRPVKYSSTYQGFPPGWNEVNKVPKKKKANPNNITETLQLEDYYSGGGRILTSYRASKPIQLQTLVGVISVVGDNKKENVPFIQSGLGVSLSVPKNEYVRAGRIWRRAGLIEIDWKAIPPRNFLGVDYSPEDGKTISSPPYKWRVETSLGAAWVFYTSGGDVDDAKLHLLRQYKLGFNKIKTLGRIV